MMPSYLSNHRLHANRVPLNHKVDVILAVQRHRRHCSYWDSCLAGVYNICHSYTAVATYDSRLNCTMSLTIVDMHTYYKPTSEATQQPVPVYIDICHLAQCGMHVAICMQMLGLAQCM